MEADSTHWITDPARRFQSWAQLSPKPGTLLLGPRFRSQVKFVSTDQCCVSTVCLPDQGRFRVVFAPSLLAFVPVIRQKSKIGRHVGSIIFLLQFNTK